MWRKRVALWEPDRHEPFARIAWDETRVREAIARIVDGAHAAYGGVEALWPIHPIDVSDERPPVLLPLYYGAAGVIWALHHLSAARRDYLPAVETLLERNRADNLRLANRKLPAFSLGDAGILMLHWRLAPSEALAQQLTDAIEANMRHPSNGFSWGAPGTMRAALFMHERTGEARWADLFRHNADILWDNWHWHGPTGCYLWTQDLYGEKAQQLGALHGFAGNAFVLLSGKHLLPVGQQEELIARTRNTFLKTALREGAFANWELCARPSEHPGMKNIRVQHCTGAPGLINTLHLLPRDAETDALLLAAGELTWTAGPLAKIPSLCHGVPGSGYAFLKLYARTGDATWLERARAFAMHAIVQNERYVAQQGQRKYSLWTGDLGLAVYLSDCIAGAPQIPMLDVF
jgi:lantibiotic modifying enzyme